jgi:hypothetical protein
MKAYKIKKTLVQEFVSFGETREQAIENFEYSQGHDFDSVKINGEIHTNGEVLSSKTTATSMGTGNLIVFNQKDWKFAKAMWLRNHDDILRIKEYDGTISQVADIGNNLPSQEITDEIIEIRDRYANS